MASGVGDARRYEPLFSAILPLPPSVNHSLMPVRMGRVVRLAKSPEARAWAEQAHELLAKARRPEAPISAPVVLDVIFWVATISSDCSNRYKPLEDALVRAGVLADDRVVAEVKLEKRLAPPGSEPWADVDVRLADLEAHQELAARLARAEERAESPRAPRRKRTRARQAALPGLSSASCRAPLPPMLEEERLLQAFADADNSKESSHANT